MRVLLSTYGRAGKSNGGATRGAVGGTRRRAAGRCHDITCYVCELHSAHVEPVYPCGRRFTRSAKLPSDRLGWL
jgi:hypothetical protein